MPEAAYKEVYEQDGHILQNREIATLWMME